MANPLAGFNQEADAAQLSDRLLSSHIVVQVTSPAQNDEVYLILSPRFEIEVVSVHLKSINGNGRCRIVIADAATPVGFDPVNTPADVDTNDDLLFDEGDVHKYDANGGTTAGAGGNVATDDQSIKLTFTSVTELTGGLTVIADIEVRHLRNVE